MHFEKTIIVLMNDFWFVLDRRPLCCCPRTRMASSKKDTWPVSILRRTEPLAVTIASALGGEFLICAIHDTFAARCNWHFAMPHPRTRHILTIGIAAELYSNGASL